MEFTDLIYVMLIVGGFVLFIELIKDSSGGPVTIGKTPAVKPPPQYKKRDRVMNGSEAAFFYELQKQLPQGYYAFPNMRIADFIHAVDGSSYYNARNKILPKHVDFLICDHNFKPVVAIEVNGSSHRRADRIASDKVKQFVFKDADMPFTTIRVGDNFERSIRAIVHYLAL